MNFKCENCVNEENTQPLNKSTTVEKYSFTTGSHSIKNCKRKRLHSKGILKAKENLFGKRKCRIVLTRELKKYKLRKDGRDDPEVLDISYSLSKSLLIISPEKPLNKSNLENQVSGLHKISKNLVSDTDRNMPRHKSDKSKITVKRAEATNIYNGNQSTPCKYNSLSKDGTEARNSDKKSAATVDEEDKSKNKPGSEPGSKNAFNVMMNARSKVIGSNSPGKDYEKEQLTSSDKRNQKTLKAKRLLMLEKMANAKSSQKIKQNDEMRDEFIQQRMEARALKLKNMLEGGKKSKNKDENRKKAKQNVSPLDDDEFEFQEKPTKKYKRRRKSFEQPCGNNARPKKLKLSSKSPEQINGSRSSLNSSVKEVNVGGMKTVLNYFEKVDKNKSSPEVFITSEESGSEQLHEVIKVKFTPKRKANKKLKKQKSIINDNEIKKQNCDDFGNAINDKMSTKLVNGEGNIVSDIQNSQRPKRNARKPIKYISESEEGLSDLEDSMIIFTPKKQKAKAERTKKSTSKTLSNSNNHSNSVKSPLAKKKVFKNNCKTPIAKGSTKLAPIFAPKSAPDKAAVEAKLKFLHSGVPEQLRKNVEKHMSIESYVDYFPVVTHVHQCNETETDDNAMTDLSKSKIYQCEPIEMGEMGIKYDPNDLRKFVRLDLLHEPRFKTDIINILRNNNSVNHKLNISYKTVLRELKKGHSEFPVYRTFKSLRYKQKPGILSLNELNSSSDLFEDVPAVECDVPENLMWTDKYKPSDSNDIIGNFDSVKTLKNWLLNWRANDQDLKVSIRSRSDSSSSSEFCHSEDFQDGMKSLNNVIVVTGPAGCGKTSSIYAIASELGIKVLEVNASGKRSGKKILSDLQEATQSHKVNRATGFSENSQSSQNLWDCSEADLTRKKFKTKTLAKKTDDDLLKQIEGFSQASSDNQSRLLSITTVMSLILIEDADLVFEQDDGFVSAVAQIVQYSKRPVILVTTSITCPHLQRFIHSNNVIKFLPLSPNILGTWIDILCLVEFGQTCPKMGSYLLSYFDGDMRKAINALQFWISSGGAVDIAKCGTDKYTMKMDTDNSESLTQTYVEDESSNMSWIVRESNKEMLENNVSATPLNDRSFSLYDFLKSFIVYCDDDLQRYRLQYPLNLYNIWRNIPQIFETSVKQIDAENTRKRDSFDLLRLSTCYDILSLTDMMQDISDPINQRNTPVEPWLSVPEAGLSESEDFSLYNSHLASTEIIICNSLCIALDSTMKECSGQDALRLDLNVSCSYLKRERDNLFKNNKALYEAINPSSLLDRRSVALDYLPTFRAICRTEKDKSATNAKRNNRFCHYLNSLKIAGSTRKSQNEILDSLCGALTFS